MRSAVVRRVRPLLDAQLGIITSAQLRELRVDGEVPRRERWSRLADGIWCVAEEPSDEQLLVALRLYAPSALASGALACRWYGLRYPPDAAGCDAVVEHGTTLLGGVLLRVRQTRRFPDAAEHRNRRLVPVDRAVADAARWSRSLRSARAVVLAALAEGRVLPAALEHDVRTGPSRTRSLLARPLQDWQLGARSAPEAEAADALVTLRGPRPVPPFLLNPELLLAGVPLGSPDGWVPSAGLGWEMDSREFHGDEDDLDATLARHQRFTDAGIELLHVTPSRFRKAPAAWATDVSRRARNRIERGWRAPSGLTVVAKGPVLGAAA